MHIEMPEQKLERFVPDGGGLEASRTGWPSRHPPRKSPGRPITSEFIGSWNAKTPSAFTENIEADGKLLTAGFLPALKLTKPMSKPFIGSSRTNSLI